MSLTDFLRRPDIRARFAEELPKPKVTVRGDCIAPPRSTRYSLIGTAFDYLLRFYIQRINPHAKEGPWIAEHGLHMLEVRTTSSMVYDIDADKLSAPDDDGPLNVGRKILKRAKAARERYLSSGRVVDSLLRDVIGLAQLDVVFRCGYVDENLGVADQEDIRDLRRLISLVRPAQFKTRRVCLLNPNFGIGSRLVGGADADVLLGETLLDIKTTKRVQFTREHFNQLFGYLALHEIWGINGLKRKPRIARIGVYFSRYGHMQVLNVAEIVDQATYPRFLKWFRKEVEARYKRLARRAQRRRRALQ
jgi:hypothetical protein